MARDYFSKKCEIPKDVYEQVKSILKGYDRLKKDRLDILYGTTKKEEGMPHGSSAGDPTARKAERLACIDQRLEAIDQSAVLMRGERGYKVYAEFDPIKAFQNYNYFNCQHKRTEKKPNGPCVRTWHNYKYRFAAIIADKLNIF